MTPSAMTEPCMTVTLLAHDWSHVGRRWMMTMVGFLVSAFGTCFLDCITYSVSTAPLHYHQALSHCPLRHSSRCDPRRHRQVPHLLTCQISIELNSCFAELLNFLGLVEHTSSLILSSPHRSHDLKCSEPICTQTINNAKHAAYGVYVVLHPAKDEQNKYPATGIYLSTFLVRFRPPLMTNFMSTKFLLHAT